MNQEAKALVVMGMHRSGTSALAKGLEALGADLGLNLMPASAANERGFCEDADFVRMNDRLLAELGRTWKSLNQPSAREAADACRGDLLREAVALVAARAEQRPILALKDPRFSTLLPFWRKVFQHAQIACSCLVALRNPAHATSSLSRHHGIEEQDGYHLWLTYNLAAIKNIGESPALVVGYENLLDHPEGEIRRIARIFGLPVDEDILRAYAHCFLAHSLNHHARDAESAPPLCQSVYNLLLAEAVSPKPLNPASLPLESWLAESGHQKTLLHQLETTRTQLETTRTQLETTRTQVAEAHSEKRHLLNRLQAQDCLIECQSERIDALRQSTSWRVTAPLRFFGELRHKWTERFNSTERAGQDYERWVAAYDSLGARDATGDPLTSLGWRSLLSVVMPVCDPPAALLSEAIESVRNQTYPHWQLCIADDASAGSAVRAMLREYAAEDPRIRVAFRSTRGHISRASNTALQAAQGEFVVLLDHDDLLAPHALLCVAQAVERTPDANIVYSDEDKITVDGRRYGPYFKSAFNRELLLCQNMISHLGAYRRSVVEEIGRFREGLEGSQDWDLALRVMEKSRPEQIVHIPRVLYHWRATDNSTATSIEHKAYAVEAGRRAVADHLSRTGVSAAVTAAPELPIMNRVAYELPRNLPLVSIIIPTRDQLPYLRRCVESLTTRTEYTNYEILIIDNGSSDAATLTYLEEANKRPSPRLRVLRHGGPFNFSALNNAAVAEANGELVCLLNNDVELTSEFWLREMVSIAMQPSVGAVGARLWYPRGGLQHGGIILGIGGVAGHAHRHMRKGNPGYHGRAVLQQEVSAVTAACLVVTKSAFEKVGGLDESLAVACNDVDFCLKLKRAGYRNVWTPYAELLHHESLSRGPDDTPEKQLRAASENRLMKQRWAGLLLDDPAYNPNLTLDDESFGLAWPPRQVARN